MKKNQFFMMLICAIFILFTAQNLMAQDKKKGKETVKFFVEKMHCKNCQATIEENVGFEKGVTDIKCDLDGKIVTVTYKADKTTPDNITKGFEKIGYTVKIIDNEGVNNQGEK